MANRYATTRFARWTNKDRLASGAAVSMLIWTYKYDYKKCSKMD